MFFKIMRKTLRFRTKLDSLYVAWRVSYYQNGEIKMILLVKIDRLTLLEIIQRRGAGFDSHSEKRIIIY